MCTAASAFNQLEFKFSPFPTYIIFFWTIKLNTMLLNEFSDHDYSGAFWCTKYNVKIMKVIIILNMFYFFFVLQAVSSLAQRHNSVSTNYQGLEGFFTLGLDTRSIPLSPATSHVPPEMHTHSKTFMSGQY